MTSSIAQHALVAHDYQSRRCLGPASTCTDTVPVGKVSGGITAAHAASLAHGSVRTRPTLSPARSGHSIHTLRARETATTSNVCGTASIGLRFPSVSSDDAAVSIARAHRLANDNRSSLDDTDAREKRRQRDATTA